MNLLSLLQPLYHEKSRCIMRRRVPGRNNRVTRRVKASMKRLLFFCGCACAGWALGVLAAVLSVYEHWVGPDNQLAGGAIGLGGVLFGTLAGFAVLRTVGRDWS